MSLEAFLGFVASVFKVSIILYLASTIILSIIMLARVISGRYSGQRLKAESVARRKEIDERWRGKRW